MQKKRFTGGDFLSTGFGAASVGSDFDQIEGFDATDCHTGVISVGSEFADVHIGANDAIQVSMPVGLPEKHASALRINYRLPGNARFAIQGQESLLLADTKVDGKAHLPRTFQLIEQGFHQARGKKQRGDGAKQYDSAVSKDQIHEALGQLAWGEEAIVEQDDGFELRPRVQGEIVPVQIIGGANGVRLHHTILKIPPPKKTAATAVRHLALRLNSRLRHARLAEHNGKLVCEARLHADLLQPAWLSTTTYAVAVAWRHVQLLLQIVAEQESVANTYVQMFCTKNEPAAPCSVVN